MFKDELDYSLLDLAYPEEEEKPLQYPLPVSVKSAEGCYLIDQDGKRYLDFTSNRETQPLGYSKLKIEQEACFLDSGLFESYESAKLVQYFKTLTGLDKAYFAVSLSETYKLSIDLVKSYLHKKQKSRILVSTVGEKRQNYVIPDVETNFVILNRDTTVRSLFTKSVGAVIIEPVQINDEVVIADDEYLKFVKHLCEKNNALLILDVSSISPLRLGEEFFNYDSSIKPDMIIISKGITQGLPFGAVITSEEFFNDTDIVGSNTTNMAYRAATRFIDDYMRHNLGKIVLSNARYLEKRLNDLAERHISVVDIQSYGMMFTILVDISAYELCRHCFEKGIIVEAINHQTIKLSPPYILGKEEIDKLVSALDDLLDKLALFDRLQ